MNPSIRGDGDRTPDGTTGGATGGLGSSGAGARAPGAAAATTAAAGDDAVRHSTTVAVGSDLLAGVLEVTDAGVVDGGSGGGPPFRPAGEAAGDAAELFSGWRGGADPARCDVVMAAGGEGGGAGGSTTVIGRSGARDGALEFDEPADVDGGGGEGADLDVEGGGATDGPDSRVDANVSVGDGAVIVVGGGDDVRDSTTLDGRSTSRGGAVTGGVVDLG